jgi:hypothetical protein
MGELPRRTTPADGHLGTEPGWAPTCTVDGHGAFEVDHPLLDRLVTGLDQEPTTTVAAEG